MKIVGVDTILLRYKLSEPMADALNGFDSRSAVLVSVRTDEGITGVGEAAYFGGPPEVTVAIVERELAPLVMDQEPFDIERLWHRMYYRTYQHGRHGALMAAISGIDIALWDILGKAHNLPIHRLLGTYRTRLPTYASGGFYRHNQSPEDIANEMEEYTGRRFRAVKMKVGRNPDVPLSPLRIIDDHRFALYSSKDDIKRLEAVRTRLAEDVDLMVDANSGWDLGTALAMLPVLEEFKVRWLEEPLFPEDVSGSAELVRQRRVPIAGYETIAGRYGYRDLISVRAIDIAQPDATWSGGITESRRIAALASCHNIPCAPHSFGSAIALAANTHLLASLSNGLILEVDQTPNALRDELVFEPMAIDSEGMVTVSDRPGLGVDLNEDAIARYRVQQ